MSKKLIDAEETIRNIIIAAPREPDEAIRATASAIVVIQNMPSAQLATDTNVGDTISRKGVFIPDITVEMFRNASLEGVEDLMASGEMEDISLPSAQPERPEQPESAKEYCAECNHIEMCRWYPYEGCEFRSIPKPERKKGKWEYTTHYGDRYRVCPFCKVERKDDLSTGWYFCPNCGEAME